MKNIIFALVALLFFACQKKETEASQTQKDSVENTVDNLSTEPDAAPANDQACENVLGFLYAYEKNYDGICERDIIDYEGDYSVNFANVDYFVEATQMKKFCTADFVSNFRREISEIDARLKREPQSDGTVDGLEADYFLQSQEMEETLDAIRDRKISCKMKNASAVEIRFSDAFSIVYKVKDGKIDGIGLN